MNYVQNFLDLETNFEMNQRIYEEVIFFIYRHKTISNSFVTIIMYPQSRHF